MTLKPFLFIALFALLALAGTVTDARAQNGDGSARLDPGPDLPQDGALPKSAMPVPKGTAFPVNPATDGKKRLPIEQIEKEHPEYVDEALAFKDYCDKTSTMNSYFDCSCLAMNYLDKRVELGPKAKQDSIIFKINTTCPNAPAIAGHHYKICEDASMFRNRKDYKTYCECFGRTVAKLYETAPRQSSIYKQYIMKQAYIQCDKEKAANRK